jgi:hypothetical protein
MLASAASSADVHCNVPTLQSIHLIAARVRLAKELRMANIRLIEESKATPQFELMKNLPDLFGGWQYESHLKNYLFLLAEGDLEIDGDLRLDFGEGAWTSDAEEWRDSLGVPPDDTVQKNYGIRGLIVTGNLRIKGSLINQNMNDGPFLLVMGHLAANNVVAGGAYWRVRGNADIRGVCYSHYNDGSFHILGSLACPVVINDDHDYSYTTLVGNEVYLNSRDENWPDDDDELVIPAPLAALLSDDVEVWGDIPEMLCDGKEVLRAHAKAPVKRDRASWLKLVADDFLKLRKVPKAERDEAMYLHALQHTGFAIQAIPAPEQTAKIAQLAVERLGGAIAYLAPGVITKEIAVTALNNDAMLRDIPAEFIDQAMCERAVARNPDQLKHVPEALVNERMAVDFLKASGRDGKDLQFFFRVPRTLDLSAIVMEVVSVSMEAFDQLHGMYVTEDVYTRAKSLYEHHPDWAAVCHRHSREANGWDFSKRATRALIDGKTILDEYDAEQLVENALVMTWAMHVDEDFVLKLMRASEEFYGAGDIAHHLMTANVSAALIANSSTNIQYLPDALLSDQLIERALRNWFTNLDCVPEHRRSKRLCELALTLSRQQNNYLIDEVIAAIPQAHRAALGV